MGACFSLLVSLSCHNNKQTRRRWIFEKASIADTQTPKTWVGQREFKSHRHADMKTKNGSRVSHGQTLNPCRRDRIENCHLHQSDLVSTSSVRWILNRNRDTREIMQSISDVMSLLNNSFDTSSRSASRIPVMQAFQGKNLVESEFVLYKSRYQQKRSV